jgi:hypothetical protein
LGVKAAGEHKDVIGNALALHRLTSLTGGGSANWMQDNTETGALSSRPKAMRIATGGLT